MFILQTTIILRHALLHYFLDSDSGQMTGNEGERDATKVPDQIQTKEVATHCLNSLGLSFQFAPVVFRCTCPRKEPIPDLLGTPYRYSDPDNAKLRVAGHSGSSHFDSSGYSVVQPPSLFT